MTDTPLTAEVERAITDRLMAHIPTDPDDFPEFCQRVRAQFEGKDATIAALTTRAEQAEALAVKWCNAAGVQEARVAELTAALTEQGLLQNTATGAIWHIHDCPASFDFAECNYRCRVAREGFALAGTEPYVSQETRRDTEVYE